MKRIDVARASLVIAMAMLLTFIATATPARAWCNPQRPNTIGNYLVGWVHYIGSRVGGVYGNITTYDPFVTYGDTSGWVLVDDGSGDYAQIGYLVHSGAPGSPTNIFTEFLGPTGGVDHMEFSMFGVTNAQYKVLYQNTPGYFTYYFNGTQEWSDPASWQPNDGQNLGELQNLGNQMLGARNSHVFLSGVNIYYTPFLGNPGWYNFDGSTFYQPSGQPYYSDYGVQKDSATQAEIWDWACAS